MTYTFDAFDTLITRLSSSPEGVFFAVQEKLRNSCDFADVPFFLRNHFFSIRFDCEKECRIVSPKNEISLVDVYKYISAKYSVFESTLKELMNLEIETEYEFSLPIQENIDLLKSLVKENGVYLISDMYLSQEHIRKLLMKHDAVFSEIPIYVSSEFNCTKRSGDLFRYFLEKTTTNPSEWVHYGDNPISDKKCEDFGAKFNLVQKYRESSLDSAKSKVLGASLQQSISTGIIRYLRPDYNEPFFDFGMEYAAPVLYPYVKWIIDDAIANGIETLYFITRDGVVLKYIADLIIKYENINIKTKLFYCSRHSIRTPFLLSEKKSIFKFLYNLQYESLSELSKLLNINLAEFNFPEELCLSKNLSFLERRIVNHIIMNDERILDKILEVNLQFVENIKKYIFQEINLNEKFSFVELQGTGKTQQCICHVLNEKKKLEISNYFYSMFKIDFESNICKFKTFAYEYFDCGVIELLCRATFGQVNGYIYKENNIVPEFDCCVKDYFDTEDFSSYLNGIEKYVNFSEQNDICRHASFCDYSVQLIKNLFEFTDKTVKNYICNLPFSNFIEGTRKKFYAPIIDECFLNDIYKCKFKDEWKKLYNGFNFDYSLKCSDKEIQDRFNKFLELNQSLPDFVYPGSYLNGRVVIYGAGKYGKELYKSLKNNTNVKIVLWCDSNYFSMGEGISDPQLIYTINFDYIIIAIKNVNTFNNIKNTLIINEIKKGKIV